MQSKTKETSTECAGYLLCGVNTIESIDSGAEVEKKHVPVIQPPDHVTGGEWFELTVQVGALLEHAKEPGHHIESVHLYAGDTCLGRGDWVG